MSDAILTINVMPRAVMRDVDHLYHVFEWEPGYGWRQIKDGKGYPHSTSAYAALGRIANREAQQLVMKASK